MWWHGGICWCVKNIPPHWPYLLENITYDMDEIYLIRLFFLCSHAHNSCSHAHGSCSWAHEITSLCGVLSFNPSATIVELGRFTIGVHKRNVSPQNHSQNTTLNYIYEKIYLVDFYMLDIHIFWLKWWWFFVIWMINMSLNVLNDGSSTMSPFVVLLEKTNMINDICSNCSIFWPQIK
jgi:hypothetical protein